MVAPDSELVPAFSLEAEMSALGSMILSGNAAEELSAELRVRDFYKPAHQEIFKSIRSLVQSHSAVDLVTLKNDLDSREKLNVAGGIDYVIQIAEYVPSAANATHYARIIKDKKLIRDAEQAGRKIIGLARNEDGLSADQLMEAIEQEVYSLGAQRAGSAFKSMPELAKTFFVDVDQVVETGVPLSGQSSGFSDLDRVTTGFYPGDLIIVGARPSMGKTSLALEFALASARERKGAVAVFSIEMSAKQLITRMVSMVSHVNAQDIKKPDISPDSYRKLADACEHLYTLPMMIDDGSETTALEMRGKCRRLKAEKGLRLVVIDYLGLVRGNGKPENRTNEVGDIARALKAMAKELEVPVILLSQLNRQVEARPDKRPMLSDLRDSGSVEAEADMVMLLYRDSYYKAKEEHREEDNNPYIVEEAEVIIAKHRNGPTGKVKLGFQPAFAQWRLLKNEGVA